MICRLCKSLFLICCIVFCDEVFAAKQCNATYINRIGALVQEKKQKIGGIAVKIPTSLAIAQAIEESGYGKSYSALKRNNHFGLSYNGKLISFKSLEDSVEFYIENISEKSYYAKFQYLLEKGVTDSVKLLSVLAPVYADSNEYFKNVSTIIRTCGLKKFDYA